VRVLIASRHAGQLVGGAELSVEQFVKSRWVDADIIRLSGSEDRSQPVFESSRIVPDYVQFPKFTPLEALINIFSIRKAINVISPDVVVFFSFWSVVAGFMDGRNTSIFIMLRAESCCGIRSFFGRDNGFQSVKGRLKSLMWGLVNAVIRVSLGRAKRRGCIFVANSVYIGTLCSRYLGFFPDSVIYPQVSIPRSTLLKCSSYEAGNWKYTVGFVGDVAAKGVEVVTALASLLPEIRFLVRARSWDKSAWVKPYPGNVHVEPFAEKMSDFYSCINVVVVPSQGPEGFGRVLVEAARVGVPSIYASQSGLREAGFLCGGLAKPISNYRSIIEWKRGVEMEMLLNKVLKGNRIFRLSDQSDAAALSAFRDALSIDLVTTNGCFDLLHSGHISSLQQSRDYGDFLIVGLNSDQSVKRLKGEGRPYQTDFDRALLLSSLRMVDLVVIFDDDEPSSLIRLLRPHVHTKGSDYKNSSKTILEKPVIDEVGAELKFTDFRPGHSTTALVEKAKKN